MVRARGCTGILFPSQAYEGGTNLVVYSDRLTDGNSVTVNDPDGQLTRYRGLAGRLGPATGLDLSIGPWTPMAPMDLALLQPAASAARKPRAAAICWGFPHVAIA